MLRVSGTDTMITPRTLLIPLLLAHAGWSIAAEPAVAQPTAEEAYVLTIVNAYRNEPRNWDLQAGALMLDLQKGARWRASIKSAPVATLPPLVWDPALAQAARAAVTRFAPAKDGDPHTADPDLAAAKVTSSAVTHLLLGEGGANLKYILCTAATHCHGEILVKEKTAYEYDRLYLCQPKATCCGIGVVKVGNGFRVAVIVGDQVTSRSVSGFGFRDLDHNGAFDQGEPLQPISAIIGAGTPVQNFPAGIWTTTLPAGAVVITTTITGFTGEFKIAPEAKSFVVAAPAAEKVDVDEARLLLTGLAKAKPSADVPDKLAFDLYCRRPRMALDSATSADVDKALTDVSQAIERARRELTDLVGEDKNAFNKKLSEIKKRWNSQGSAWLDFAKSYYQINQEYTAWSRTEKDAKTKGANALIKAIDQLAPKVADATLWGQMTNWKQDLEIYLYKLTPPTPEADPKKKPGDKDKKK